MVAAVGSSAVSFFAPNLHLIPVENFFPWQKPVISFLTTPPGSPSKGDRHLVIATATAEWTGHETEITYWDGLNWIFFVPSDGWFVYNKGDNLLHLFDGAAWTTTY